MLFVFGGVQLKPSLSSDSTPHNWSTTDDTLLPHPPSFPQSSSCAEGELRFDRKTESLNALFSIDTSSWQLRDLKAAAQQMNLKEPREDGQQEASPGAKRSILWPSPRRGHSINVLRKKWLVVFGGLTSKDSVGQSNRLAIMALSLIRY